MPYTPSSTIVTNGQTITSNPVSEGYTFDAAKPLTVWRDLSGNLIYQVGANKFFSHRAGHNGLADFLKANGTATAA